MTPSFCSLSLPQWVFDLLKIEPNPSSFFEAQDWTHIFTDTSWVCNPLCHNRNSLPYCFNKHQKSFSIILLALRLRAEPETSPSGNLRNDNLKHHVDIDGDELKNQFTWLIHMEFPPSSSSSGSCQGWEMIQHLCKLRVESVQCLETWIAELISKGKRHSKKHCLSNLGKEFTFSFLESMRKL